MKIDSQKWVGEGEWKAQMLVESLPNWKWRSSRRLSEKNTFLFYSESAVILWEFLSEIYMNESSITTWLLSGGICRADNWQGNIPTWLGGKPEIRNYLVFLTINVMQCVYDLSN